MSEKLFVNKLDPWDLIVEGPLPYVFLQWKGTDVCLDFYCPCGADTHYDGYGAATVRCPACDTVYELAIRLNARKTTDPFDRKYARNLELDDERP